MVRYPRIPGTHGPSSISPTTRKSARSRPEPAACGSGPRAAGLPTEFRAPMSGRSRRSIARKQQFVPVAKAEFHEDFFFDCQVYGKRQSGINQFERTFHRLVVMRCGKRRWPHLFLKQFLDLGPILFDHSLGLLLQTSLPGFTRGLKSLFPVHGPAHFLINAFG
jgi:hypothetical protein